MEFAEVKVEGRFSQAEHAVSRNHIEHNLTQLIHAAFPLAESSEAAPTVQKDEWPALAEAAERHGLAPLLYASLKVLGARSEAPPTVVEGLWQAYLRAYVGNWMAYKELDQLLECFETNKIPVLLLKGCALATMLYPEVALRPLGDLDLLIPSSAAPSAKALLIEQGYEPHSEVAAGFDERFSSEQALVRGGRQPAQVDLHWHLFVIAYYRRRIPIEWFWDHTTELRVNGRLARTFAPEAQLIYLSAHSALHHPDKRLIWSYDIALLLSFYRRHLDWAQVIEASREFGLTEALKIALIQVREHWDVSIPPETWDCLSRYRPALKERLTFALAKPQHSDLRSVVDGITTAGARAKLRYWRLLLFPDPEYMRTQYAIRHHYLLPYFYLRRIVAGLYKAVRAAISLAAS